MPRGQPSAADVVRGFLRDVRSGRDPDAATRYLAPVVRAHQLAGEAETIVERTPAGYADHVREMVAAHGAFDLDVLHLVADGRDQPAGDVAVFWRQTGGPGAWETTPDGRPLVELAAAVYRVRDGLITEYWLLLDRLGLQRQAGRRRSFPTSPNQPRERRSPRCTSASSRSA